MKSVKRICLGLACITIALGIILVIFAWSFGGNRIYGASDNNYELEDTVEEITSMEIDVSYGTVKIVTGDKFHVKITNMPKNGYKSYVKDNTWIIEEDEDSDYLVEIFGFKIPVFSFGLGLDYSSDNAPKIIVTIPEGFHAQELIFDLDAGLLTANSLSGDKVELTVDAGKMEIDELIANTYVELTCGAGDLEVKRATVNNANVDCGLGRIRIKGSILGDSYVTCGVGDVSLDLDGNEEDYNYSIDCGIGHVIINDRSYSGTIDKTVRNNNAIGSFELDCGVGRIELIIK